ncbi:MAG TPA: hypothetical protein PKV21_09105, partial [bacterium]|nr:hypothetical protein [bacterium]
EMNNKIYEGIIDKVFIEKGKIKIYEFKTYFSDLEKYKEQLEIYKIAMKKIFNINNVECFIINLSEVKIVKLEE